MTGMVKSRGVGGDGVLMCSEGGDGVLMCSERGDGVLRRGEGGEAKVCRMVKVC